MLTKLWIHLPLQRLWKYCNLFVSVFTFKSLLLSSIQPLCSWHKKRSSVHVIIWANHSLCISLMNSIFVIHICWLYYPYGGMCWLMCHCMEGGGDNSLLSPPPPQFHLTAELFWVLAAQYVMLSYVFSGALVFECVQGDIVGMSLNTFCVCVFTLCVLSFPSKTEWSMT